MPRTSQLPTRHPALPAVRRAAMALCLAAAAAPAEGQATIRGRVVDSETGAPVIGATVKLRRGGADLVTDSAGRFLARDFPAGESTIQIEMTGYAPGTFPVKVPDSGEWDRVFSLDFTGQRLAAVAVQARAEALMPRYAEFERRRQRKLGAFLRWDELTDGSYASVGDALRKVRGVRIKCNQETFECLAYMSRTPQCQPVWFVDGVQVRSFHENTPIRDIYGVEIYRGPGETPGEYSGSNAACGAIVLWTKSRPYRVTP
jgi:hypothetical protein